MRKFKIKSFCKVNLYLKVLKKLNNGYHNIKSLITFCEIHDVISICKINGLKDQINFYGKFKNRINRKSNTITRVLYLLRKKNFFQKQAFKIDIQKNIPHGSGLGGGSTNAAVLLNFLNSKMRLKLNKSEIIRLANSIGSDVPIGLEKKNTLLTGRKEKILRFNQKFGFNILIVYPNIICSTRKIYLNYKKLKNLKSDKDFYIKNKKKLINFLKNEDNDLEDVVIKFYPKIKKIINFIQSQNGCYFSRISGSGSACIGIFSTTKTAIYTQKLINLKYPKYWCVVSKTI